MPSVLDANFIAPQTGEFEPQRTNHFYVTLKLPVSIFTLEEVGPLEDKTDFSFTALRATPPSSEIGESELKWFNEGRYVPGKPEVGDLELEFYDYLDSSLLGHLYKWANLVYSPHNGQLGLARDYKSICIIHITPPYGLLDNRRTCVCTGIFPKTINYTSGLSYENADVNKITVTMSVDEIYWGVNTDNPEGIGPVQMTPEPFNLTNTGLLGAGAPIG